MGCLVLLPACQLFKYVQNLFYAYTLHYKCFNTPQYSLFCMLSVCDIAWECTAVANDFPTGQRLTSVGNALQPEEIIPAGLALNLALRHVPQIQLPKDIEAALEQYLTESGVRPKHAKQRAMRLTDDLKALSRFVSGSSNACDARFSNHVK